MPGPPVHHVLIFFCNENEILIFKFVPISYTIGYKVKRKLKKNKRKCC